MPRWLRDGPRTSPASSAPSRFPAQDSRNGWEERKAYDYETSPNERVVVGAYAVAGREAWTVVIIDASEPTFEKRLGPFRLAFQSIRPKGHSASRFRREKKANPLDEKRLAVLKEFVANGMKMLDTPGVAWPSSRRQDRLAGGLGVRSWGGPIRSVPTRSSSPLEHEGADDAPARRAGGRREDALDQPVTELFPAFR